mmetsp:Transcript_91825/g.273992  ORF Transcript_91825/g.273992 Transcript_91825/m.273992 type:complete len:241 (-) Transcript_91825:593-1315(-)
MVRRTLELHADSAALGRPQLCGPGAERPVPDDHGAFDAPHRPIRGLVDPHALEGQQLDRRLLVRPEGRGLRWRWNRGSARLRSTVCGRGSRHGAHPGRADLPRRRSVQELLPRRAVAVAAHRLVPGELVRVQPWLLVEPTRRGQGRGLHRVRVHEVLVAEFLLPGREAHAQGLLHGHDHIPQDMGHEGVGDIGFQLAHHAAVAVAVGLAQVHGPIGVERHPGAVQVLVQLLVDSLEVAAW